MTQIIEIEKNLTDEEKRQVQAFAEFLVSRRSSVSRDAELKYLDVDAIAGMCEGLGGNMTSVELVHEALAAQAAKYDRDE